MSYYYCYPTLLPYQRYELLLFITFSTHPAFCLPLIPNRSFSYPLPLLLPLFQCIYLIFQIEKLQIALQVSAFYSAVSNEELAQNILSLLLDSASQKQVDHASQKQVDCLSETGRLCLSETGRPCLSETGRLPLRNR